MNVAVYLFGKFNGRYDQYPDDNARLIFNKFCDEAKRAAQIAVHRDKDLMYYGFIAQTGKGRYAGLCVVVNGLYLDCIDRLFAIFERTVKDNKAWFGNADKLHKEADRIGKIAASLREEFDGLESRAKKLPVVGYGRPEGYIKHYDFADFQRNPSKVVTSSYQDSYTFIYNSNRPRISSLMDYVRGFLGFGYPSRRMRKLDDGIKLLAEDLRETEEKLTMQLYGKKAAPSDDLSWFKISPYETPETETAELPAFIPYQFGNASTMKDLLNKRAQGEAERLGRLAKMTVNNLRSICHSIALRRPEEAEALLYQTAAYAGELRFTGLEDRLNFLSGKIAALKRDIFWREAERREKEEHSSMKRDAERAASVPADKAAE